MSRDCVIAELRESLETLIHQAPGVALAWITFLGGCIGSFINVVAYRLPAGQSLLHPGSYCPRCQHPIRWYDNLPVLGWLHLRGRCRDCQAAISPRYPLVEALLMFLFANQWLQDVYRIPPEEPLAPAWFAFVWHVSLLCVLICAALIDFDGHDTPPCLLVFGVLVPLGLTWISAPEALRVLGGEPATGAWLTLISGAILAGLVCLVLAPGLSRQPSPSADATPRRRGTRLALAAMAGLYLGPEKGVATLVLTMVLWHLMRRVYARRGGGAPWSWYLAALAWVTVVWQP